MKWTFLLLAIVVSLIEALLLSNLKVFSIQMSLYLAFCLLITLNRWVSYRTAILITVIGGYLLDIISSYRPGSLVWSLLASILLAIFLSKHIKSRRIFGLSKNKLTALLAIFLYIILQFVFEWPVINRDIFIKLAVYYLLSVIIFTLLYLSSKKLVKDNGQF